MNNKILIVDDDTDISRVLKIALQRNGYNPIAVFDAITAIRAVQVYSPALIILDISMPGHNGLEVAEFISGSPKYSSIPIIVLTASENDEYKKRAEKLGVFAYMKKPFEINKILATIKTKIA